jgi:hypothetical protein
VAKRSQSGDGQPPPVRALTLRFDDFAWEAINEEAHRLGVSNEDLARFSVLYYLADLDSGRIARGVQGMLALRDT